MSEALADAVVIGAGPAGASCALWLHRLGANVVLLEAANQVGGLLASSPFPNDWNVSLPHEKTGRECAADMALALKRIGVRMELGMRARVQADSDGYVVTESDGFRSLKTRIVVLATGTRLVDGGYKASDRVRIGLASFSTLGASDLLGARVAVLGGGDSALEAAMLAQAHQCKAVSLFARSRIGHGHLPMSQAGRAQMQLGPVSVDATNRTVNGQRFDYIVVAYGFAANVDALSPALVRQLAIEHGRISVTSDHACGPTNLFAAGDITNAMHPCSVTAMAQGISAAKAVISRIPPGSLTPRATAVV